MTEPLVDRFGRIHDSLRISVTDRCNIRCSYCMPDENVRFLPRSQILTFEEISQVVDVAVDLGIRKIRLTGGEPLVRQNLAQLVRYLSGKPKLADLAMTTNGILLPKYANELREAGLKRLNISLDTLREEVFQQIARRPGLSEVFRGIQAAQDAGFENIRINAIAIPGINEDDLVPLTRFCRDSGLHLRFIEFMPLDAERTWTKERVLTGETIRRRLEEALGPLLPMAGTDPSQPATDFEFQNSQQKIGFINTISQPFCGDCNRLRLTAEGQLRNCLFGTEEWDVRQVLRGEPAQKSIADLFRECVGAKKAGHGIDDPAFVRPLRDMYQIGG